MPITKKQSDVPGVSEEEAAEAQKKTDQEKLDKEKEQAEKGNIVQVSSADLHNYPEVEIPLREAKPQEETAQPKTGASAIAKEE